MRAKFLIFIGICICFITNCEDPNKPIWTNTPCGRINTKWVEDPTQTMKFGFVLDSKIIKKLNLSKDSLTLQKLRNKVVEYQIMYYLYNGIKQNVKFTYLSLLDTNTVSKLYFNTGEIMRNSWGTEQQKKFFIDWPNGDTDTVVADFGFDRSRNNEYCSMYPLINLTFNGKKYKTQTKDFKFGVYLFE